LAAVVGVDNIFLNPLETITTDFLATEKILRLAKKEKVKKVFFASSSEVYGTNTKMPLKEDSNRILGETTNPRWSYAASKALAEQLCFSYRDKFNLPLVVGRFFNIYGPGSYNKVYMHVIVKFIIQALKGEKTIVYGSGNQTRSFTYIDDAIEAIYKLSTKSAQGVFNIGSPEPIKVIDLARKIIFLTKSKSKIVRVDPKLKFGKNFEDVVHRLPDIGKVQKEIGFRPKVSLDEGLEKTINWIKRLPNV
jgi:UDP-glucose 4-epimerase